MHTPLIANADRNLATLWKKADNWSIRSKSEDRDMLMSMVGVKGMECSDCGWEVDTTAWACPRCGLKRYIVKPETGAVGITGYPPGFAVESPVDSDGSRCVEYRPSTGGRSVSKTYAAGSFDFTVSGPLQVGRAAERHAITTLINAL